MVHRDDREPQYPIYPLMAFFTLFSACCVLSVFFWRTIGGQPWTESKWLLLSGIFLVISSLTFGTMALEKDQ
jgi:4-hydroxybenzoate polyprenyltransferase